MAESDTEPGAEPIRPPQDVSSPPAPVVALRDVSVAYGGPAGPGLRQPPGTARREGGPGGSQRRRQVHPARALQRHRGPHRWTSRRVGRRSGTGLVRARPDPSAPGGYVNPYWPRQDGHIWRHSASCNHVLGRLGRILEDQRVAFDLGGMAGTVLALIVLSAVVDLISTAVRRTLR